MSRYVVAKLNGEPMFEARIENTPIAPQEELLYQIFGVTNDPWWDWAINGVPLWDES